jgi:hypothetical protein
MVVSMERKKDNEEVVVVQKKPRAFKPDLSKLRDAVDAEGNFLLKKGDNIVVQYPDAWRGTETFVVSRVNYETGDVAMWSGAGFSFTNFRTGPKCGQLLKIPNVKRRKKDKEEK